MPSSELIVSEREGEQPTAARVQQLPRLLVLGDVPVAETYHGSLLLYRLLQEYPTDRLTIVETGTPSAAHQRLPNVEYHEVALANQRWLNTRFHGWFALWFSRSATSAKDVLRNGVDYKAFDAVLTVGHGFGWLAAARVAEDATLPLHMIIHDDWPRVAKIPGMFRSWLDGQFRQVYRQSASRLCVSPGMRSIFFERYGADADVLYPSRSRSCPDFELPPTRLSHQTRKFTVAFAGTINSEGYVRALRAVSKTLDQISGRLLIFGPLNEVTARSHGLDATNVELGGLLPPAALLFRLREEADCLFVPMSFDSADRDNMELAFPSKLADYTAVGVPLMIYGPSYCSAVEWARANEGVAEVIDGQDESQLAAALRRLNEHSGLRVELGKRALAVGRKYFAASNAQLLFEHALLSANRPGR